MMTRDLTARDLMKRLVEPLGFFLASRPMSCLRFGSGCWLALLLCCGAPDSRACLRSTETGADLPDTNLLLERILERAKAVAAGEDAPVYTYQSRTVLEQLKDDGKVMSTTEKTYRVNLISGYPIHKLTKIKGRDLTVAELAAEQEKEGQLRRRFTSLDMETLAARKETWLTSNLLARYEFKVVGRVMISNRATLVLTFEPRAGELPVQGTQDRLLNRLAGKLWVDEEDADAVKVSVSLVETLSMGWFGILGSLSKCELTLERLRMPDGVWANARQTLELQVRKLASTKRFRMTEMSGGYRRVESKSTSLAGNAAGE